MLETDWQTRHNEHSSRQPDIDLLNRAQKLPSSDIILVMIIMIIMIIIIIHMCTPNALDIVKILHGTRLPPQNFLEQGPMHLKRCSATCKR